MQNFRISVGLMMAAAAPLHAAETPEPQQVQVTGARADQRQRETTTSIIVPHAELVRSGDQSLADALKRLPGISISSTATQGAAISLRGLGNGYTQILLNSEPVPAGFQLDSIALETVERVEVMRSTTAEFSNQAVAGTINIILRKAMPRDQQVLGASLARQGGMDTPALSLQLSDQQEGRSFSLAAALTHKRISKPVSDWEELSVDGRTTLMRHTAQSETRQTDTLTLTPRLNWQLDGSDTLTWQGYANLRRADNSLRANEADLIGDSSEYPHNRSRFAANFATLRSDLNWVRKFDSGAKLEWKLGLSTDRRSGVFDFNGTGDNGEPLGRHHVDSAPAETTFTTGATWRQPVTAQHALAAGWDASHALRREDRNETLLAPDGTLQGGSNANYRASVNRLALFAQDEWELSERASLYLGLRHESLSTTSRADASNALPQFDSSAAVWSPSLQARLAPTKQDVLRLALSRSYKAPALSKLVPRRYTNDNNNNPTNPDEQGNPALRPELAWGLDASYEHYLGNGALLSIGAYARRIRDVTQSRLFEQDGVWVIAPFNDGNASAHGLELEAKLPLRLLLPQAPALDLRANLARNWSRVDQVPAPYNRLENQTPLTANLGADYRWPATQLSIGGNLSYQAGGTVRQSAQLLSDTSARRELDVYGTWKASAAWQWRLSASGLLAHAARETTLYSDASGQHSRTTLSPAYATLRLMLERQW
jgi:outer membrane receptor protein involved in Fe transport